MKKEEVIGKVKEFGDAVITYKSKNSKKLKYNICTLDFDTAYIQSKNCRTKPSEDEILFFCWDTDTYRILKYDSIANIVPLTALLKGVG